MRTAILTLVAALLLTPAGAAAGDRDVTGHVGMELRAFPQTARHAGQPDGAELSALWQPELYWRSDDDAVRAALVLFARTDARNTERRHVDVREAFIGVDGDGWDARAGIGKEFWGVAESRHLVDVINQADLVEDIDQEDKLGQPLLNLNLQREFGRFGLYVLPYFRERTFPGADARFRPAVPVDADAARYESSRDERHIDYAVRYSHYVGHVDLGLHVFDGTSREPLFVPSADGSRLVPFYEQMRQVGVDLQYTHDAWLWKLELLSRAAGSDDFVAAVGGFEYTFYGVRGSAVDVGLLAEFQYDDRGPAAPPTIADNDLFIGLRLALNDAEDSSLLAGTAIDADTGEVFLNVEAERRFGDSLVAELRLRAFAASEPGEGLHPIERDDYLQLRLSWYY